MSKTKILVVEDEPQIFTLIKMTMAPLDFDASYLESTQDITSYIKDNDIEIVITDFLMPRKNGLEVARDIRNDEDLQKIPIVMLTSKELRLDETKEVTKLGIDYLRKPFMPQVLSSKMKEILSRVDKD